MNQTNFENGNSVETCLYKNRIEKSVETFKGQMSRKFSTNGKIIGKDNYEFCVVDGRLVQVIPSNLHKPLKRVIKTLENEGLVSSANFVEGATSAVESVLVAEEATM